MIFLKLIPVFTIGLHLWVITLIGAKVFAVESKKTKQPTLLPTLEPTPLPTFRPTSKPTKRTKQPTPLPTIVQTTIVTIPIPTLYPTTYESVEKKRINYEWLTLFVVPVVLSVLKFYTSRKNNLNNTPPLI